MRDLARIVFPAGRSRRTGDTRRPSACPGARPRRWPSPRRRRRPSAADSTSWVRSVDDRDLPVAEPIAAPSAGSSGRRDGQQELEVRTRRGQQVPRRRRWEAGCARPPWAGCRAAARRRGAAGSRPISRRNAAGSAAGWTRLTSGWPTKVTGTPRLLVERLLERKDHEHARDGVADGREPAPPPGPYLGRDVVDDGNSAAVQGPGEAEVEVGIVDEDGDVRPLAGRRPRAAPEDRAQVAQVGDDLEEPDDGEVAHVGESDAPWPWRRSPPRPTTSRCREGAGADGGRARRRRGRRTLRRTRSAGGASGRAV